MLSTAVAYLNAKGDTSINAVTFVVTLLDFTEVGDMSVFIDEPGVRYVEEQMMERGYLDSREMATMFNMLRANDLIWSNVVNNYLLGKEPPAFDLLFWNADGTRMAAKAHSFYLRAVLENRFITPGKIVIKGVPVDLHNIHQDVYAIGTIQDHIVPWKSAWKIHNLVSGPVRFVLGTSGHINGITAPPNKARGYWTNDRRAKSADEWMEGATKHDGSWWTDWGQWLKARSGELVAPPSMGNEKYRPLVPAPGTYVLEK
jgi:polyhydroxyalkanoate synthase